MCFEIKIEREKREREREGRGRERERDREGKREREREKFDQCERQFKSGHISFFPLHNFTYWHSSDCFPKTLFCIILLHSALYH